jgi:hypothetical protein
MRPAFQGTCPVLLADSGHGPYTLYDNIILYVAQHFKKFLRLVEVSKYTVSGEAPKMWLFRLESI